MAIKRAIKAGNKSIISFKKAIKVGEITQLVAKDKIPATKTEQGVTFTNNGDGSVTANGVSTNQYYSEISINIGDTYQWQEDDHKYLLLSGLSSNAGGKIECILWVGRPDGQPGNAYNAADLHSSFDFNFTIPKGQYIIKQVKCRIRSGYTAENVTFTPQLFDLTEMFGAGHEPTTVAEFKAKFPEAYYPYQRAVLTVYNKVVRPCVRKGEVVQLVNAGDFNESKSGYYGVDYTDNGDGSWTLNGTCTTSANYDILYHGNSSKLPIIKDHIYLILDNRTGKINNAGNSTVQILNAQQTFIIGTSDNQEVGYYFKTSSVTTMCYIRIRIEQGVVYNNVKLTPQLFDLTAMYGAGNEPKTLADFRKDFSESYYPYSPIQTKNLFDIRKYTGLVNSLLNNLSAGYFVKNLTQNSLIVKMGGYGSLACLKEPIILPAGTYTFSCDCDYDAINNGSGVRLGIYKKNEAGNSLVEFKVTAWKFLHRLVLTFTLEEETAVYLELQGDGTSKLYNNLNNVFFNIQLEKGSVATDYVPHDYI